MSKLKTGGGKTLGNEEMFVNFMILGLHRTPYFMHAYVHIELTLR